MPENSPPRPKAPPERRNNALYLRREILTRLTRAFLDGNLAETVDRIPFDMRPKKSEAPFRCCIYKERAILRLRCVAGLGFRVEEDDDVTPLADYARRAVERKEPEMPVLTVIDIACRGCVEAQYHVTDLCQGCVARPCTTCNFGAVALIDGRAVIDKAKCRNCGRCMQLCPYQAIVKIHVPCEEACPVGAIRKGEDKTAVINPEQCTSCGRCMRACPFGAVMERSQLIDVLSAVRAGKKVVALPAPAIVGQFPQTPEAIAGGLKALGFSEILPVAVGADQTTREEAAEFVERMKKGEPLMTTSCCPAYVETAKKHLHEILPFISQTPTPMRFAALFARRRWPDCVTVFIGPCVAKRAEGMRTDEVDYVLTFEELGAWLVAAGVDLDAVEPVELTEASAQGIGYAITGGVAGAVRTLVENGRSADEPPQAVPVLVNGLSPDGIKQLRAYTTGSCPGNLVEVMTCEGGCVGGAGTLGNPKWATREIQKEAASARPLTEMDAAATKNE